ncbi:MAG: lactonase family protein [Methylococcaceae bacterium]|nr:lactonase family protein [Methylococcaceae bacterium]
MPEATCCSGGRRLRLPGLLLLCFSLQILPVAASQVFYTTSNNAGENQLIRFRSGSDGVMAEAGRFATGGLGTGRNLQAAGSIAVSHDRQWLLAVNAGSDQISAFRLGTYGPRLTAVRDSGGKQPLSIAVSGRRVYVLNSGSGDIASFKLTAVGRLEPLADGTVRPLSSTEARATSLGVTADGRHLVVAERGVNRLATYAIGPNGVLSPTAQTIETVAKSPYALSFLGKTIYSVFAGQGPEQSAVGAYRFDRQGDLVSLGTPLFSGQTAACWSALSARRRLLYAANAGSHTLTGLRLREQGWPSMLNPDGVSADTGPDNHPRDMTFSQDGKTLAVILSGEHAMGLYRVGIGGHLKLKQTVTGLPDAAAGLVSK